MKGYSAAVILNYNDNKSALRLAEDFASVRCLQKVIVADNGPESSGLNGNEPAFNNPDILFIKTENRGYAAGNNRAVDTLIKQYGLPEFILISNPDIEVSGEAIQACMDFLIDNPDFAVAAPQMRKPDGARHHLTGWKERSALCDIAYSSGILSRIIGMYRETYPEGYFDNPVSPVDCVHGSFFVIRGDAFREAGYFDETTFLFYEEDILGYKLKQLGFREAVLNTVYFIHREGVSSGKKINYINKYLTMQKSRLYFHSRYKRQPPLIMAAFYAATALGFAENLVKTVIFARRR